MSTEVKLEDHNEVGSSLSSESKKAPANGTVHLAMMGTSTEELLRAVGTVSGKEGGGFTEDSLFLLDEIEKEMSKTATQQEELIQEVGNGAGVSGKGVAPTGKDAIFEAAKDIQLLQSTAQKSLENQIQQELKLLKVQLEAAEKEEAFWEKFSQDWAQYEKDPTYENFAKLMQDIMKEYPKGSKQYEEAKEALEKGQEAWNKEQKWEHESGWHHFWHGEWFNPHDWEHFREGEQASLAQMIGVATSTPGMFSLYLENITTMVKNQVQNLMFQIEFLEAIETVLSGKGNAIVMMESLMMIISQMGLAKNSEQVNRNKILNNATILGLEQKNKEMEKLIKKIHSEHHGLFGWLEDLVESIAKVFERLFDCVEDLATGNFDKLGKDFMKLTGLKEIFAALEDIAKGIESGNWSEIGKGLEDLAADLLVSLVFGPEVLDTKFGKDMTQTVKLAIDTVVAIIGSLALLFAAAGEKMGNSHADVSKILGKAGDLWKKVAENPQLQAVLQVVMVVMIVAAVVSQQYWLAGLMLVMFALSTSGVLEKATSALAEALGKIPGLSKDAAKIIADVLVIVIVTALSLGAGSIGAVGETAANEVSELTDEMEIEMENFVANTTDTTEEIANQTTEQVENAPGKKNVLNRVGNAIGRRAGATLTGFGSALGSTSLGEDIANVALKKNKKEWEMILEIIQGIIAAVASLGGGLGISASDTVSTADQAIQRGLGKILPKLAQYMEDNAAAMMEASLKLQGGGMGIGGMASAEVGGSQVVQGEIMKKLREMQSDMTLFEATSNETESQNNYLSGRYKILMKEMENIVKEVNQAVTAPIQGEIRALMGQV